MSSQDQLPPSQEQLIGDLRLVIENAEELLKNTGQYSGELYTTARARLTQALQAANQELSRYEDARLDSMIAATEAANLLHSDLGGEARLMRAFK